MPSRPACVAILLFWVYAAGGLFRRDILPDFWETPPPDLRSIARAEDGARSTEWELTVAEGSGLKGVRSVGRATTSSIRTVDGGTELIGDVTFDSGSLLKGTRFDSQANERIDVHNRLEIDPSGNLRRFRAVVKSVGDTYDLLTVEGEVKGSSIEVQVKGPVPFLNWSKPRLFAYQPRELVQNSIGPIDRLPGLQVGQRWMSRVVSPLTGRVEEVKVEVTGKRLILWNNVVVTTLEVVSYLTPISAKTWVRPDGLVLRQEVPFPFVKLVLERLPDRGDRGQGGVKAP